MTQPARNNYDVVPNLDRSHSSAHPNRMATIAACCASSGRRLNARVLELGCANAGILLPMTANLPGTSFVGVDYSARQIAKGQAALAELGLTNITLRHGSILDVDSGLDQFDYIIAHGVFLWISPEVQDKMLAICRQYLAPNRVAYISFNTLPGWYGKLYVRDRMLHYTCGNSDPQGRIRRAREVFGQMERLVAWPTT